MSSSVPERAALKSAHREWLLRRAQQEVDADCSTLAGMRCGAATSFLELTQPWPKERTLSLLRALVKRCGSRPGRSELLLEPDERATLPLFEYPAGRSRAVLAAQTRLLAGEFRFNKSLLKKPVERRLAQALGTKGVSWHGAIRFVSHLEEVTVYTDLDFGQRNRQMTNSQSVVPGRADHTVGSFDAQLLTGCSIANLLGWLDVWWEFITPDDIPRVADFVAEVSLEFITAVPGIIQAARSIEPPRS